MCSVKAFRGSTKQRQWIYKELYAFINQHHFIGNHTPIRSICDRQIQADQIGRPIYQSGSRVKVYRSRGADGSKQTACTTQPTAPRRASGSLCLCFQEPTSQSTVLSGLPVITPRGCRETSSGLHTEVQLTCNYTAPTHENARLHTNYGWMHLYTQMYALFL